MDQKKIRNFCIIAHIDHGKSTLADRILELTDTVTNREMKEQYLDSMDLERERGITIKLNAVQMLYHSKNKEDYIFHLIDTPGHVDFTYEVSRTLRACEGALLVVDATQGIEAQTLANAYLALDNDLEIIPVINKIDLPSADVERVKKEIEDILGISAENAPCISAKTGLNVIDVLERIVEDVPPPPGDPSADFKALIFDSKYDAFKGAISYIRVFEGEVNVGDKVKFMATNKVYDVVDVGISNPLITPKKKLVAGEVGYLAASIKDISSIKVGDTITNDSAVNVQAYDGYKELNPVVFAGFYPIDTDEYTDLREALDKLSLSDSSLKFEAETSLALGFGFRVGFLGLLHMEIIRERITREYGIEMIVTAPSVKYNVYLTNGEMEVIDNPANLPDLSYIDRIEEPMIKASIMLPSEYIGNVMELCQRRRGEYVDMKSSETRATLIYRIPLAEVVFDFFNKLKSTSKGYASFDYELDGYQASKLSKMNILINNEKVDALSTIVHKDFAYSRGKAVVEKLQKTISRQMFEIPIQAALNNKIIARETIKAYRKNVIAKCYGGDISRKRKLLEKQKEGKKKMKYIGSVEVPQEAFLTILKVDD